MQATNYTNGNAVLSALKPKTKILFASFPADGHFNPLTGLAVYLKKLGHDVRWYCGTSYAAKIERLGIHHYEFKRALEVTGDNVDEVFPERKKKKSQIAKLKFDLIHAFVLRSTEYYDDIREIYKTFSFDLMIADVAFTAIPMVKEHLGVPVLAIGVLPLPETSKDLAPTGLGITPSYTYMGRKKQAFLRFIADNVLFKKANEVFKNILSKYNITSDGNLFDTNVRKATLFLQSGTPGFEYYRSDINPNVRFIGPLLPYSKKKADPWFNEKLVRFEKIILVTQGTVEKDITKIIVPVLEAFKDTDYLVIATTGGTGTKQLQQQYQYNNLIIEDFIPFNDVMPYADVYITNGGYGGVMLGIQNKLPMIVAGVHEGKNEINARVGYFNLGINLKTEKPKPHQMKKAVEEIFKNNIYKENVVKLSQEFSEYYPQQLCANYVEEVIQMTEVKRTQEVVY